MLKAVLVGSDDIRLRLMQHALVQAEKIMLARAFDRYPTAVELIRALNTYVPDVLVLDFDKREEGLRLSGLVQNELPKLPIIGITSNPHEIFDPQTTGVVYTLTYPLDADQLVDAIRVAVHVAESKTQENLFVFLPSKAGSGCSAVVLNTASILANTMDKNVLLLEADLRSGTISTALNHTLKGSIQDALANSQAMDIFQWQSCVTKLHGISLLLSNRKAPERLPDWADYWALLQFASSRYDTILVDLPELVNPGTSELVRRAKLVFIVCTQEILSLKLAEQRCLELAEWGVKPEQVRVLINRWHNREMSREDVRQLLDRPVMAVFPNDYPALRKALIQGTPVAENSKVGVALADFAKLIAGSAEQAAAHNRNPFSSLIRSLTKA